MVFRLKKNPNIEAYVELDCFYSTGCMTKFVPSLHEESTTIYHKQTLLRETNKFTISAYFHNIIQVMSYVKKKYSVYLPIITSKVCTAL